MARVFLLLALALASRGEVIDRIAVIVGNGVITDSDIRRQLRFASLLSGQPPDYSAAARRDAAEQLVRQELVRREIELSRYTPPGMAEVEAQIEKNLESRGETAQQRIAAAGLTGQDVKEIFLAIVSYTRFVDFRFSPGVNLSEEEIAAYYEQEFLPQSKRRGDTRPMPLEEARPMITRILNVRKSNEALDQWLAQTRQQVEIRFIEEVFR